jgi:Virulence-associated protein E
VLTRIDDISVRFLRLILPETGIYIADCKPAGSRGFKFNLRQFASTIEELAQAIENLDQDGYETYHACASFREPRNDPPGTPNGQRQFGRTQKNALGAKAFWLDIDAGPGKAYRDQDAALKALEIFCRTLKLPAPIVVYSGGGLHCYWPLQRMLDRETWQRYARGLKHLCNALHADPTRTADISSVLRTPGTHNRKSGGARLVECDPKFLEIPPYAIERFDILAAHADAPGTTQHTNAFPFPFDNAPKHLSRRSPRRRIAEALRQVAAHAPASGLLIVEQCGQVRALRDKRGCLPEPTWYAALGVLAFCEDGRELAHAWSSGYPGYTVRETQERLDRAQSLTGATTCEHFHSLDPKSCEACPHWQAIKSPIVLGQRAAEPVIAATGDGPSGPAPQHFVQEWQGRVLKPKSYANTRLALIELGVRCRHDIFHDRKIIEGDVIENLGPELSDSICRALRDVILARYRFDPGTVTMQEAAERACEENRFDPVLDYLDALQWDGQKRLDRWLVAYLNAEDTELNRTIGRLVLTAAVRRARQPGCKFDQIVVLEGVEGTNKSTAIELMAGKENFSDQTILGLDDRTQMECLKGKWLYEIADLSGMAKSEVDAVKAFASRTFDRARAAYGRYVTEQPRRCVFFATTNNDTYLKSQTGNRRFWPVRTGRIDIDALRRDRDQLWAEASQVEASRASLALPERLWGVARIEQEKRQEQDPWDDLLAGIKGEICPANDATDRDGYEERIASTQLLSGHGPGLGLDASRIGDRELKRLGYCMRRLGWQGPKPMRIKGQLVRGYSRKCTL